MKLYVWDNPWHVDFGDSLLAVIAESRDEAMSKVRGIFAEHRIREDKIPIPNEVGGDGILAREWSE